MRTHTRLTKKQLTELELGFRNREDIQFSRNCHIILLIREDNKYNIERISNIFQITIKSIRHWIKSYEKKGVGGLMSKTCNAKRKQSKIKYGLRKEFEPIFLEFRNALRNSSNNKIT